MFSASFLWRPALPVVGVEEEAHVALQRQLVGVLQLDAFSGITSTAVT